MTHTESPSSFSSFHKLYRMDVKQKGCCYCLKGGGVNMGHHMCHEILYYVNIIMN